MELTRLEAKAVVDALNQMFRKESHFSICTVDTCMKLTGASRDRRYEVLRLYHCHNWASMDAETKANIFQMTVDLVCGGGSFPEIQLVSPEEKQRQFQVITTDQKPSMFKRLFGGKS